MRVTKILGWWGTSSVELVSANRFLSVLTDDLTIPTYDAAANVTHCNYVYFDTAWNGYKYWAVFTPYPSESRENPSIIASNDGETWAEPPGITNPIDLLNTGDPYNSDPDIVYVESEDKLYVIYRTTNVAGDTQVIKYKTSSDGVTWSSATNIQSGVFQTASSFSFVLRGTTWYMWYVDTQGGAAADYEVYLKTSSSLATIWAESAQLCTISDVPSGYHNWQFCIIYDSVLRQYVGAMVFTLQGVVPNNGGIIHMMTSTNGTNWTVATDKLPFPSSPAQYLFSIQRTELSEKYGAAYDVIHAVQWDLKHTQVWLATDNPAAGTYDGITTLENVFSVVPRLSSFAGMPLFRTKRSSDSDIIDVYADGSGGLEIADGTALETYKGVANLEVLRWYNQSGSADYLVFVSGAAPFLIQNVWAGCTKWGVSFDGVDNVGDNQVDDLFDFVGMTSANYLNSGRMWSVKSGSNYFGILSGSNIALLNGTNISAQHLPKPCVYTAYHGGSGAAKIRRDSVQIATGSTTNPDANQKGAIGAQWATSVYSNFFTGKIAEIVMWDSIPSAPDLAIVEAAQAADFPFVATNAVYDTYTDANGTAIASHVPETRPGSNVYSTAGGTWTIQSNKLTLSSASGTPYCVIDAGITDGIVSGIIDPGGSGGSGLVFRFTDVNNFIYIRLFGGTTLGVFKYVAGSFSTVNTWAVAAPGEPFTLGVELIGTLVRAFLNGVLVGSTTVAEHTSATSYGWVTNTSEGNTTTFDELTVTNWAS